MQLPSADLVMPPKLPAEAFYGLLTAPVGQYGRACHGGTTMWTLRGSDEFLTKAQNLFDSFGGCTENGRPNKRKMQRRPIEFHPGNGNSIYFCLPERRFLRTVTLYLHCQLMRAKGVWDIKRDADGMPVDRELLNEVQLGEEARELALSFVEHEVATDYSCAPHYGGGRPVVSHGWVE